VETVTVITLTRRRPLLVQRAIRSVRGQRTGHAVSHLVLVDDCPETAAALAPVAAGRPDLEVVPMSREPREGSGLARSSRLRNLGVRRAASRWIAFLDDDNEWEPGHLQSLVECALASRVRAAHSHVSVLNEDGTPYLEPAWPWARGEAEARRLYREYVAKGICAPGSNVIGDRPDLLDPPVDTSAWLLARQLLLEVPFTERFTRRDAEGLVGEDDKLFQALVGRREPIACTRRATLRYYLGGYSNNPAAVTADETFTWATE
jgi:glycosyltransferase involved in cell wall biosynthesis